jgi:hypothetical protein
MDARLAASIHAAARAYARRLKLRGGIADDFAQDVILQRLQGRNLTMPQAMADFLRRELGDTRTAPGCLKSAERRVVLIPLPTDYIDLHPETVMALRVDLVRCLERYPDNNSLTHALYRMMKQADGKNPDRAQDYRERIADALAAWWIIRRK